MYKIRIYLINLYEKEEILHNTMCNNIPMLSTLTIFIIICFIVYSSNA